MDRATCSAVRPRPLRAGIDSFDPASLFRRLVPLDEEVDDRPPPRPRRTRPLVAAPAEQGAARSEAPLLVAAPGSPAWEVLGLSGPDPDGPAERSADWAGQADRRWGRRLSLDPVWDEDPADGAAAQEPPARTSVARWDDLPLWVDEVAWGDAPDPAPDTDRTWSVPPTTAIEEVFRSSARDSVLFGPPT